jgi:hypothetical protein
VRFLIFLIVLLWSFPVQAQGTASFLSRFDKIGTAAFENRNATKPMSVVLFLMDDVGKELWLPSHETGEATSTTNLDTLRTQGITFTNSYVTPLCGVTHVQLHTARWAFRTKSSGGRGKLNQFELTLGDMIRKSDQPYRAAWFGKWNAANGVVDGTANDNSFASGFGWDAYIGHTGTTPVYSPFAHRESHAYRNGFYTDVTLSENTTDYYADKVFADAISWLGTIGDDPYVLVLSGPIGHSPLDTDNTLVIFHSDDGDALRTQTTPCVGTAGKGLLNECGINVGMVMAYGNIPSGDRNSTNTSLVNIMDVTATIADVVGAKYLPTRFASDTHAGQTIYLGQKRIQDGLSLQSIWLGRCNGYEWCWTRDGGSTRLAHSGLGGAGQTRVLRNATHKIHLAADNSTYTCYSMDPPNEDPEGDESGDGIACDSTHDSLKTSLTALEATGS